MTGLTFYFLGQLFYIFGDQFISFVIISFAGVYTFGSVALVSTHLIYWRIKMNKIWEIDSDMSYNIKNGMRMNSMSDEINQKKSSKKMTLIDVFNDCNLLELFAQHLIKEFSIECLIAYIEMLQFKQLIPNEMTKGNKKFYEYEMKNMPNFIPKSKIINDNIVDCDSELDIKSLKRICYLLIKKFFVGEMEINISYELRNSLNNYITDREEWMGNELIDGNKLFHIFDECIREMFFFQMQSLSRFLKSKDFSDYNVNIHIR